MNPNNADIDNSFWENYFNSEAGLDYAQISAGQRWYRALIDEILDLVEPGFIGSIADLGCGIGIKTVYLAKKFPNSEVVGFDLAESAIAAACKYWKSDNLTFLSEGITTLKNSHYDLICMFDVLEHIEDWANIINDIAAISPRYLLFSFPTGRMRPFEKKVGHYRNFKRGEVENHVYGLGFKPIKIFHAGFPFYSPVFRDLNNIFYKPYSTITQQKITFASRMMHNIWFILFRYFSSKNMGDNCMCLFERV